MIEPMNEETMRCPTCRAVQPWSDTCRRCKTDLRLVRELAEEFALARRLCLSNLNQNRFRTALVHARRCVRLRENPETLRLLAVCELLNQNWSRARSLSIRFLTEQNGE